MFHLPKDLEEEVLSRIPVTSSRKIRFTCKKWNILTKGRNFTKKHLSQTTANKFMVVLMMENSFYLMSINFQDTIESCIKREDKLISLDDSYEVDFGNVYHCDGLLLCITKDHTKLLVWNPYWGQTRWIEPTTTFHRLDCYSYAIGYDKSKRFIDRIYNPTPFVEIKIYDLNSDSWRVLDAPPDGQVEYYHHGLSLKGDTYWLAIDEPSKGNGPAFLNSFDYTKERFGALLHLPFEWYPEDTTTLSNVKEENLAVLFQRWDTLELEIWITTEIKPNTVSWNNKVFLAVDMRPLFGYQFDVVGSSFFIDEEKKVAVVFDRDEYDHYIAYIIGVNGSCKKECLGEIADETCSELACSKFNAT